MYEPGCNTRNHRLLYGGVGVLSAGSDSYQIEALTQTLCNPPPSQHIDTSAYYFYQSAMIYVRTPRASYVNAPACNHLEIPHKSPPPDTHTQNRRNARTRFSLSHSLSFSFVRASTTAGRNLRVQIPFILQRRPRHTHTPHSYKICMPLSTRPRGRGKIEICVPPG